MYSTVTMPVQLQNSEEPTENAKLKFKKNSELLSRYKDWTVEELRLLLVPACHFCLHSRIKSCVGCAASKGRNFCPFGFTVEPVTQTINCQDHIWYRVNNGYKKPKHGICYKPKTFIDFENIHYIFVNLSGGEIVIKPNTPTREE